MPARGRATAKARSFERTLWQPRSTHSSTDSRIATSMRVFFLMYGLITTTVHSSVPVPTSAEIQAAWPSETTVFQVPLPEPWLRPQQKAAIDSALCLAGNQCFGSLR
jgi:hypothetical protein